jgi:hypothetical protein
MNVQKIYEHIASGKILTTQDRESFEITSVKDMIDQLCQRYNALFHATRKEIPYGSPLNLSRLGPDHRLVKERIELVGQHTAFATNYSTALIIKALFSNHHGLDYSYGPINYLGLNSINDGVVNDYGFIYLLTDTSTFKNARYSDWEKYTTVTEAKFAGGISVTLDDLPPDLWIYKKQSLTIEELRNAASQV